MIFFYYLVLLHKLIKEFDLTGLSYHIGANDYNPADRSAPNKLDKNGAFVLNPGLGFGIDFRSNSRDKFFYGLSPVARLVFFS